jgi:hypothetical protein
VARVRPFFDGKHRLHFGSLTNSGVLSSVTWPISDLFRNARKDEDSRRNRFSRDARQRRVDVARRRRGWRSIAHTVSPCGSANRRCVWSTDAAHLASIVCRQPPKKSSQDRSKLLWTRRDRSCEESPTPPTGCAPSGRITCTALPKPPARVSEGLA